MASGTDIHGNVKHSFSVLGGAVVADFVGQGWIADGDYELLDATERHAVAGAAANLQLFKVPSGTAKASGTNMLSTAGFAAAGTADTNVTITAVTTAVRFVARGDMIAFFPSAASAALAGVTCTIRLRAVTPINNTSWPSGPGLGTP